MAVQATASKFNTNLVSSPEENRLLKLIAEHEVVAKDILYQAEKFNDDKEHGASRFHEDWPGGCQSHETKVERLKAIAEEINSLALRIGTARAVFTKRCPTNVQYYARDCLFSDNVIIKHAHAFPTKDNLPGPAKDRIEKLARAVPSPENLQKLEYLLRWDEPR